MIFLCPTILPVFLGTYIPDGNFTIVALSHHIDIQPSPSHRLVLHQFHLKSGNLGTQSTDLLAGLVLVDHHFVLDVSGTVSIFQCV